MADVRKKVYEVVEPGTPTWWKANRHKVMFFLGALAMFLIIQTADGKPSSPAPGSPRPSASPGAEGE